MGDEYEETAYKHIFAIGDVQGKAPLTPVAIAAGRRLANRLFGGEEGKKLGIKLDYNIKVYKSNFTAMYFSVFSKQEDKEPTAMKMICTGEDEEVVGIHMIGQGSDEMTQGFAVAVKMGAR